MSNRIANFLGSIGILLLASSANALTITTAELRISPDVIVGRDPGAGFLEINLKPFIKENALLEFDLSDLDQFFEGVAPSTIYEGNSGKAFGFVETSWTKNSASLTKGLRLEASDSIVSGTTKPTLGKNIEVNLNIIGTWDHPGGSLSEVESIEGELFTHTRDLPPVSPTPPPNIARAGVKSTQQVDPFLPELKTDITLTTFAAGMPDPLCTGVTVNPSPTGGQTCVINESISQTKSKVDPQEITFTDRLNLSVFCGDVAGIDCTAISDFSKTLNERAVATPESSSSLSLLALGFLGFLLAFNKQYLRY